MLKRIMSLIMAVVLLSITMTAFAAPTTSALIPPSVSASSIVQSKTIKYADGSKIIITKYECQPQVKSNSSMSMNATTSSYCKTASVKLEYDEPDKYIRYIYYLWGNFTVNPGVNAVCTDSWDSYNIYDSSWSNIYHFPSYINNSYSATAKGNCQFSHFFLGIAWKTQTDSISVSVDSNGVIY